MRRTQVLILGIFLVVCIPVIAGAQITSAGNGNWTSNTTWVGGVVPDSTDNVVITAGDTITVNDYYALCNDLSFTGVEAQIKMAANSLLAVYGNFTLAADTHCVFDEQWSATDARIKFAGSAVQTLSGWNTSSGSTSFRDVIINKSGGMVTTDGTGMRLGIQNSLDIINGIFELAVGDDIEGRYATSGNYTNQNKPDVLIQSGGEFETLDGTGAHHIRSYYDSGAGTNTPTGIWTVYGVARFRDGSTIKYNLSGMDIENGGKVITSTGNAGGQLEFGPVHVKSGGEVENYTISDIWGASVLFTLDEGGLYDTKSATTVFPVSFTNNGSVRYSRVDETGTETDQTIVDMDYYRLEVSADDDNNKNWALAGNRLIADELETNSSANLVITAAAPRSLTVGASLRMTSGTIDNSDVNVSLTIADGTTITRATGTINSAPVFAGTVDLRYVSTMAPVTTGPELPTAPGVLADLSVTGTKGVNLGANVTVNDTCTTSGSDLVTGSYTVTLASTAGLIETDSITVLGNITTTRTASQSVNETFGGIGVEIDAAGGAPGATTVLRVTGQAQSIDGDDGIERYFDISPSNNSGLDATVVFHYDHSELNGINEGVLAQYATYNSGVDWVEHGGTVDDPGNTVTKSGITSLSTHTLGAATSTGTVDDVARIPNVTGIVSIYPNPFNPRTTIVIDLAETADVDISIYDVKGRRISTLKNGVLSASRYDLTWQGLNDASNPVASGIYFCRMTTGGVVQIQKMVLLK